jgi:uncharacterized protein YggE
MKHSNALHSRGGPHDAISCLAILVSSAGSLAQTTLPMPDMHMALPPMHTPQDISVVATGSADYVPDVARVTLGVRADSPSAATAIDTINKNAAQVITALQALGIKASSIKTVGYNLQYRERSSPGQPALINPPMVAPLPPGTYEASEMLQVSAPVTLAGKVLDAAIGAGANESFGLSYQTTNFDSLYRGALAKAMASARATADALAKAAHVTIVDIESISNCNCTEQPGIARMAGAQMSSNASVLPGTDAVSATVYVVYRIR